MLSKQALFEDFFKLLNKHIKSDFDDEIILFSNSERTGIVERIIAFRHQRDRLFGAELFADPAWDILLDLYRAQMCDQKISVSSACIAAQVPPTTGLRWLSTLEERGLVARSADPHDGRRVYVALLPAAMVSLKALIDGLADFGKPRLGSMSIAIER